MIKTIVNYVNFHFSKIIPEGYSDETYKAALIYEFLYEHYIDPKGFGEKRSEIFKSLLYNINYPEIKTNNSIIRNHLIFLKAFKNFYEVYKVGRGCVYLFDFPIKSEVLGFLTGIIYWCFHRGPDIPSLGEMNKLNELRERLLSTHV